MSLEDAGFFISKLRDENRYHEDIFGVTLRTYEVTNRLRSESIAFIEESKRILMRCSALRTVLDVRTLSGRDHR
uniref:nitric-oxide synthase (NADPH) n=1 Tax=Anguilla anguilla TaxID=7936 RepID=A0A0E9VUI9_ANGAN